MNLLVTLIVMDRGQGDGAQNLQRGGAFRRSLRVRGQGGERRVRYFLHEGHEGDTAQVRNLG